MNAKQIIKQFENSYKHLIKKGMRIGGVNELQPGYEVISVSVPFIFDNRELPEKFHGYMIRPSIKQDELPIEFKEVNNDKEYLWAYQRFERYVENNEAEIRKKLNMPETTKSELLDALCFGDFGKHKEDCIVWEQQGKIPKYVD
jgi:hypothetical protein